MRSPVPVVLVGAGRVAHAVYLRLFADLPEECTLVGIVETNPDRARAVARRFPGVPVTGDVAPAVRAGARAAVCATPWPSHARVVDECLGLGLPVLCEKPVSLDPAEVDWLRQRERATGLPVSVGYMKRHDPAVAAFVAFTRERLDELRLISVRVVDPNAPHQVGHLVPAGLPPAPGSAAGAADQAVCRILGPRAGPYVRTAYAHGLGGSLIHHVNLAGAVLDGSGRALLERAGHVAQWHDGRSVLGVWQPTPAFAVHLCHVRVPEHRRYREVVEAVTETSWARLRLPSPYARDAGAVLDTERWDGTRRPGRSTVDTPAAETGFVVQLRRWAASLRGDADARLPGLAEAARDVAVVHEAGRLLIAASPAAHGGRGVDGGDGQAASEWASTQRSTRRRVSGAGPKPGS